jgi:hypothetical protein
MRFSSVAFALAAVTVHGRVGSSEVQFICLQGQCVQCAAGTPCVSKDQCEQLCKPPLMVCVRGQCLPYPYGLPEQVCQAGCGPMAEVVAK